jgi:hypothetical protein
MAYCYQALGRAGGRYTTLEHFAAKSHTRKTVRPDWILGPALFGRKIGWKEPYNLEGDPELRTFGREWFQCVQKLIDQGRLQPHPIRVAGTSLEEVINGVDLLRKGAVSGQKLVYIIRN